jgi:hypothetical protein
VSNDLALQVAVLKVISDYALDAYDQARARLSSDMGRGDRKQVRSPHDSDMKIGPVWMTDPKKVATVTDEGAFYAWMAEHYPEHIDVTYVVSGTDDEVVDVLIQHAGHLLKRVRRVHPEVVEQLRADSVAAGAPVGPGGEADIPGFVVEQPPAVVACKPNRETALPAVIGLIRSGAVDLQAILTPALEGGADDRES